MNFEKIDHEDAGWSKLDEVKGKCISCDKEVFTLVKVLEQGPKYSYFSNCPYCGNKTWTKKIEGKYILGFPEDLKLLDSIYDNDTFELKVSK